VPKYLITAPDGGRYEVTAPEGVAENEVLDYAQTQLSGGSGYEYESPDIYDYLGPPDRSLGGAASSAFSRGKGQLASLAGDVLPALGYAALGKPRLAKQQLEEAAAAQEQIEREFPAQVKSYKDITLGNLPVYATEKVFEQVPNLGTSVLTGGVSSLIGRAAAKGAAQKQIDDLIVKRLAERAGGIPAATPAAQEAAALSAQPAINTLLGRAATKGAERGFLTGAFGSSTALGASETFQNIYQATGELDPAVSIFSGALQGALDSILPVQLSKVFKTAPASFQKEVIKKIGERKGLSPALAEYSARAATGVGKTGVTEGLTEGAQEAISIAAEKFVQDGEQFWGSEDFDRTIDAVAAGFFGGGPFGAITGVSDAAKTRGIEAAEFARREPSPKPEEGIDETLPPAIDAGPIAERSALTPVPVPPPVGGGLGSTDVPPVFPGLNEEVAPEVRDVELTDEDTSELRRQTMEEENRLEAERNALEDIEKETEELGQIPGEPAVAALPETPIAPETPVEAEAPKLLTRDMLVSDFKFSPKSKVVEVLADKPYKTPEQVAELRSLTEENIKNPNQKKRVLSALSSLAPERELRPIPEGISAPELIPVIEQDKNAYTAIERVAGRNAAIAQLLGDKHVGKLPEKEALPYSGPTEQAQFEATLTDVEKASVRERLKGLRAADRRRERVVAEKEARVEAATPEAQEELTEVTGEGGAFETLTVPDIEKVTGRRAEYERLRADAESLVGNIPKGEDPMRYLTVAEKAIPDLKERAPVSRFKNFLKKPENEEFLDEVQRGFAEAPAQKKVKPTTPAKAREVIKGFLGREPENEDIRITTTPRAAGMKGVPQKAQGVAEIGGKKAALFTKRIPGGKEISVFMHEVGAHVGMERLVGKTNYKSLIDKVREWGSGKGGEQEVAIAKAALARIPAKTRPEVRDDEAIAYFISEAVERGISPKAIAKVDSPLGTFFRYVMLGIKNILKQLGMPGYEPTTQDIVDIAYGAAQLTYKRADDAKATLAKDEGVKKSELPKAAAFMERPVAYAVDSPSDPVGGKALINKIDSLIRSAPEPTQSSLTTVRDNFEGLSRIARKAVVGLLSVEQLADQASIMKMPELAKKIKEIATISTNRDVAITNQKKEIGDFLLEARRITAKYKPEVVNDLYDFMHESSILGVKFDIDKRIAAAQKDGNTKLVETLLADKKNMQDDLESAGLYIKFKQFEKRLPELAKLYYDLRDRYKKFFDEFLETVNQPEVLGPAGKIINELMKKMIDPYFPLYRRGEFWVRFTDERKREGVAAFETEGEAREFIYFAKQNKVTIDKGPYIRPTESELAELMPTGQVQEIIKLLNERGAPAELKESVYSIYLSMFPNQSIMQAFQRRKNRRGFRQDALANFADVGTRMAINIEQFKTVRKLDGVLKEATKMAQGGETALAYEIGVSLKKRSEFLKNPVQKGVMGAIASAAGHNAYRWFILGNISSAFINTLQLPIIVAPLLGGKFGWGEATAALRDASSMYFKGGSDNNTNVISPFTKRNMSDFSIAGSKSKLSDEQRRLFENAIQRGAVRRSTGQDLMEIREFGTLDPSDKFGYKKMQVEMSFGWAFQNAERFNREVTLFAAYNLARKKMSEAEATEYALSTVELAHGSAMSELGPQLLQTGWGKIIGVFKRFALNQVYLQYKLFRDMFKGADADVRKEARRQLLGMYATTFAFAGVKGVPAYGLINILATMLAGVFGDDDEPFDLDEIILTNLGNEVFRGPIGALTDLNIATRVGFADLFWRPDEKRLADIGLLNFAMEQALGPVYGVTSNLVKGATQVYEGDFMRGMETMLPSSIKSGVRTYRLATEGAVNSKGFKIIDDPSFYDLMMSATGFSSNELNDAYARASIAKQAEREGLETRKRYLTKANVALRAGDIEEYNAIKREAFDKYNNSSFGKTDPLKESSFRRSYEMYLIAERNAVRGVVLTEKSKKYLMERAGIREEDLPE
jgi:hypothetical protein